MKKRSWLLLPPSIITFVAAIKKKELIDQHLEQARVHDQHKKIDETPLIFLEFMEDFKLFPLNCLLDIVEDMIIFCYTYPLVRKLLHIFYEELQVHNPHENHHSYYPHYSQYLLLQFLKVFFSSVMDSPSSIFDSNSSRRILGWISAIQSSLSNLWEIHAIIWL